MRTTIELSEANRAILVRLAAERREKGFSRLVAEAIDACLDSLGERSDKADVRRLKGVLSPEDAAEPEQRTRAVREPWL